MSIRINPFGGSAEIGSNMVTVDDGKDGFIIDCGILFPYDNFYDINYLIPDFSNLNKKIFKDIVFTHGHEDHIGAAKHLFRFLPEAKVHASVFTKKLIQGKLDNFTKIHEFEENIKIGKFTITPVHVNHSIPETKGLVVHHKDEDVSLLYISDFKLEPKAKYETFTELERIKSLQNNKINLAMIDSTNITLHKKTAGEDKVAESLDNIIANSKGRVLISLFSSNVHRIKAIYESCIKHNRSIFTSGRSVKNYIKAAIETNIINETKKIYDDTSDNISSPKSVVIISGCQGDFFSSLRRYAAKEHSKIKIQENDLVVFSSKAIPGNEKSVARLTNQLVDNGVKVLNTYNYSDIHSSGHPSREELNQVIESLNITHYIPIHGESFFLDEHEKFVNAKFKNISTLQVRNFDHVLIKDGNITLDKEQDPSKPKIFLNNGTECSREVISERRKLATRGLIIASCHMKSKSVEIDILGLQSDNEVVEELQARARASLNSIKNKGDTEKVRLSLLKYCKEFLKAKPIIKVYIL